MDGRHTGDNGMGSVTPARARQNGRGGAGLVGWMLAILLISTAYAQGEAIASGGNITPANLNLGQPLSQWYFFYSATNRSSGSTITLSGGQSGMQALAFPTTSGYYLISDSDNPFGSELAAPDLDQFDTHFNLSSRESASVLFNDTSRFELPTGTQTPGAKLDLPTLYIQGQNDTHAFRVGLAQAGSSFVFIVPNAAALGMDGVRYDFQFFLPYSYGAMQTFRVFSISLPSTQTASVVLEQLNYRWTYNGSRLTIQTVPDASVSLVDLLGKAYNQGADGAGVAALDVLPGRYTLHIQKSGYYEVVDTIYLSAPIVVEKNETKPELEPEKTPQVSVTRSLDGVTVCLGSDCYFQNVSEEDSTRLFSELDCKGTLCELINISPASYIQKHQMRRVSSQSPQTISTGGIATMNLSAMMDSLGRGVSERFGLETGTGRSPSGGTVVLAILAAMLIGVAIYLLVRTLLSHQPRTRGGYD